MPHPRPTHLYLPGQCDTTQHTMHPRRPTENPRVQASVWSRAHTTRIRRDTGIVNALAWNCVPLLTSAGQSESNAAVQRRGPASGTWRDRDWLVKIPPLHE
eukprot:2330272-Rhodomonas_salina.1